MSDEELFGSAHGEHLFDKLKLRLLHVRQDARLGLRLLLRAHVRLLREELLLRTELWLRKQLLQ
jgi:hypothetical protein